MVEEGVSGADGTAGKGREGEERKGKAPAREWERGGMMVGFGIVM